MPTPEIPRRTYHDEEIVNVETHHEESDVNVRALLWFVVIFVVFAAVAHFALLLMFKFFVQLERGNSNAPLTSMAKPPDANVPQLPRLQPFPTNAPPYRTTPAVDMVDMRAHEDQVLNHYGWVDRQKGVVHIPIEDAKRAALASGMFKTGSQGSQGGQGKATLPDSLDPLSPRLPAAPAAEAKNP